MLIKNDSKYANIDNENKVQIHKASLALVFNINFIKTKKYQFNYNHK